MADPRKTYEEAKWAQLSPAFRAEHNRLRKARGLRPIPPPKVDRYAAPGLRAFVCLAKMKSRRR